MQRIIIYVVVFTFCLSMAACSTATDTSKSDISSGPALAASESSVLSTTPSPPPADTSSSDTEPSLSSAASTSNRSGDALEAMKQKGLKDWQIKSLAQRGFSFEEQLEMDQEEIDTLLAPGSTPSYGREFTEDEMNNLRERNIADEKFYILRSLGYEYDDMMLLTDEQINFIFPNTDLVDKLVLLGYEREAVAHMDALIEKGYSSYKELLDEVFDK